MRVEEARNCRPMGGGEEGEREEEGGDDEEGENGEEGRRKEITCQRLAK